MAAGLGFKDFTTGEVLTAADVDGYLMQGIWVFASAAARDAAVTSPQEGNFAFTKDNNSLWYYDGAAWVSSGATGDIEGVTAGIGISGGGTSGTVTVTNSMATAIDAKGDLVAGTGADTFAKLTVGANNTVLTADSSTATGLKWATPASGGGITLLSTTSLTGASTTISSISQDYNYLYGIVSKCTNDTADGKLTVAPNNTTAQYSAGVRKSGTSTVENFVTNNTAMPLSLDAVVRRNDTDNTFSFFIYDYTNTDSQKWKNFFILGSFVHTGGTYVRAGSTAGPITGQGAISSLVFANSGGSFIEGTVQLYGVK